MEFKQFSTKLADTFTKDILKKLTSNYGGFEDENPRPKYKDGTPAHSKFITDVFEKYNIFSLGELPTTTLKPLAIKTGISEIMWFYQDQSSSLFDARFHGINWWESWDIGDGTIGQRYGATVKKYDIINKLLKGLEENPFSRRHIIDLYQYSDFEETNGLYPCAFMVMFSVVKIEDYYLLETTLVQRSSDYLMANHINKMQYLALSMMICSHLRKVTGNNWKVGSFAHLVKNLHIYDRHMEQAKEMLERETVECEHVFELPVDKNFYDITLDDFVIDIKTNEKLSKPLELAI